MWVFGYGSLMWDNWESTLGCLRRVVAELPGFRRAFNKGSVRNWGTKERPGPTLNLTADSSASCKGVAFQFPGEKRSQVLSCLKRREGKGFDLKEHEVTLETGDRVKAVVPIYFGKNLLLERSPAEVAAMVRAAEGERRCIDYVRNIAGKLAELGIDDPAVHQLWQALEQEPFVAAAWSSPKTSS